MTIIIGYDGSEGAKGAIEFDGEYFSGRDAIVVTAFQDWPPAVQGDAVQIDGAAREKAEAAAEEGAALARQAGIKAGPRTVYAGEKAWQSIIDVADELDAGLIVDGSHGVDGLRPLVLGSVSHQLGPPRPPAGDRRATPEAVAARREQKKAGNKETTHTH